ncbi:MAG: asparagine synthase C-terminal domain-containing protein, partial [Pseudomonadota bacterium]|nr:asparagine synthase C-terminal domain-containing protein [Pseudomonadota bacterium]
MDVLLNRDFGWDTREFCGLRVHGRGDAGAIEALAGVLAGSSVTGIDAAAQAARAARGHFAAIVEAPGFIAACVDHCRSIPVFFTANGVSNDAHLLKQHGGLERVDDVSVLEAAMAGFVTGPYTLYQGLSQLQAGEVLWHDRRRAGTTVRQYYVYLPDELKAGDEAALLSRLETATDRAISRVVANANGRPVWVALSAGLDSRLILCKLVEQGCPNLLAFTYGPSGNDEARAAREIAGRLGVPWRFWPSSRQHMRKLFDEPDRERYWAYGDGLCALPNLQDFPTLHRLKTEGEIPEGVVVVNGQTGDFISGGHIPRLLRERDQSTSGDLFAAIVAKHYSLWRSLKTPANLDRLRERVWSELGVRDGENFTRDNACALYERFEYQERQAKHIINGQRNYDFLGLDWALPLWDRDFVDFWRGVPYEQKFEQRLYRRMLDGWNFAGLFRGYRPVVWQWPGAMKAVLPV